MEEKAYLEFLEALASEFIQLKRLRRRHLEDYHAWLSSRVDYFSNIALLAKIAGELMYNDLLRKALGSDLKKIDWPVVFHTLDEVGITDALDEYGETLLRGFRSSVVPDADLVILYRAGVENPEATLRLAEEKARTFAKWAETKDFVPSNIIKSVEIELEKASNELESEGNNNPKKPRKWFKGISRILAGGAGAIGNVLLGIGTIPTTAPIGAAAVLGSCTGALVLIGDGIEALSGR